MKSDLEEKIADVQLSERDKYVLDYLLYNKEEACLLTSNQIAHKLNVSPSTVVRLSTKLGFENFAQMKRHLQERVLGKKKEETTQVIPYEKIKNADKLTDQEMVTAIWQNAVNRITRDARELDAGKYIESARLLSKGKRIFVVGHRACAGLAASFSTMLACIRPGVYAIPGNQPVVDTLIDLSKEDVMVAISYERYSSDTIFAVKMAKDAGSKIIALTDSYASPIARNGTITLINQVENFSFFNSYAGTMVSIEILTGLVSKNNRAQNEARLIKMEEYLKDTGQY